MCVERNRDSVCVEREGGDRESVFLCIERERYSKCREIER